MHKSFKGLNKSCFFLLNSLKTYFNFFTYGNMANIWKTYTEAKLNNSVNKLFHYNTSRILVHFIILNDGI